MLGYLAQGFLNFSALATPFTQEMQHRQILSAATWTHYAFEFEIFDYCVFGIFYYTKFFTNPYSVTV